ncbi:MAG TPA: hypothetical protein VFO82_04085 [Steroidobacteraceae bacterium]|nr:hypothetical protein [Steroidobacteraceae bacterium]
MLSVLKQMRRVGLAVVALGSIAVSGTVFAQNTPSGTSISNTATVNYSVNSVNQTAVSASTSFLVDTVINLNVTGAVTYNVTPGALGQVATYTVTNTSNITSDFTLVVTDETAAANDFDMSNLVVHVDNGDNVYNAVDDTATSITGLASGASRTVFVTGDVPGTATDNQDAPVRLTATAINPADSLAWVNDTNADDPDVVQIVVANDDAFGDDTFHIQTATLGVTKSSAVITDNLVPPSANPKAIPGATVEYTITIANTGSQAATLQSISDPVPAATTFRADEYPGATDVSIQVDANPATYCTSDADADGCDLAGTTLTVGAPAITSVAAGSTVTVRFRVTIN